MFRNEHIHLVPNEQEWTELEVWTDPAESNVGVQSTKDKKKIYFAIKICLFLV